MFNLFKSRPLVDPVLGELRRARGLWHGTALLEQRPVPIALSGSRSGPEPRALDAARALAASYPVWRPSIEGAMFEHYSPYAEAAAASPLDGLPAIRTPPEVWPHTHMEFVQVVPLGGQLTVEIGYRVAWDKEHTLGARFRDGELLELCGSVLAP